MSVIAVYSLSQKFVNRQEDIPESARQVVYYALAVGHHVGVMDCFKLLVEIPVEDYREWLAHVPDETARRKLEGALRWGEIEVNRSHVKQLLPAIEAVSAAPWAAALTDGLREMLLEPAYYLMFRRRE